MNILEIIVICFLVFALIWGAVRGFLRGVLALVRMALVIVLAWFLTPRLASVMEGSVNVQAMANARAREIIEGLISLAASGSGTGTQSGNEMAEVFVRASQEDLAAFLIVLAAGLIIVVLSYIILLIVCILIVRFAKSKDALGGFDRFMGAILSLVKAVLTIWFLFAVVDLLVGLGISCGSVPQMIGTSKFLTVIHNYNPVSNMLAQLVKGNV